MQMGDIIRRVEIRGSAPGIDETSAKLTRLGQATKLSTQQMTNMQFQLQDMVVGLTSGQSPFTVLMQQGSQLAQSFQSGTGVMGALRAVGTGIVSFITNPLNLAVLGFAVAAAAASSFFGKTKEGADKSGDALKQHETLIRNIKNAWGDAAKGLDAYNQQSTLLIQGQTRRSLSAQQSSFSSGVAGLTSATGGLYISRTARQPSWMPNQLLPQFSPFANEITALQKTQDVLKFQNAVESRLAISPNAPSLQEAGARLLEITNAFADQQRQIQQLQAALGIMNKGAPMVGPSSGAHGPGWMPGTFSPGLNNAGTFGADFGAFQRAHPAKAAAVEQKTLNDTMRSYTGIANPAADAARAYGDALQDSVSRIDSVRSSLKSLIDTALQGGNVLKALAAMLLDLGSTGITNALLGPQGTGAGGALGGLMGGIFGTPTKPMNLAADPLAGQPIGGNPWAPWLSGSSGGTPSAAMGGGGIGSDVAAASVGGAVASNPLLAMIAKHEGTMKFGDPYNTALAYGAYGGKGANLTGMTINQVLALGDQINANPKNPFPAAPLGAYQIVPRTLRGLVSKMGLTGNELYSPALQDQMALLLAQQAGVGGLGSTWTSLAGVAPSILSSVFSAAFHSGGMVGEAGPSRMVPAALFTNAPRMHSGGLAYDERPTILQTGERVLSRAQVRSGSMGGHTNINIDARGSQMGETHFRGIVGQAVRAERETRYRNFGDDQRSYNLLKG